MLDDANTLGMDCSAKSSKKSFVHFQGLSAVKSVFISVAGEYTLQNAELLSRELLNFVTALPPPVQSSVEFFELLQEQLLHLHWFLTKVAEETKVYLLDFSVRQILAKYVTIQPETAQNQVTRWLWIVYCTYFRYATGLYNSLGVCRLILKFLQSIRKSSPRLWDHFVEIEKKFLKASTVDAAKYQDVPCFCPKPGKQVTVPTVIDLTADESTETPEDLKYQEAVDRLKKLRNDLEIQRKQQQRRNGLLTRTNLKGNTVICISDDDDEEDDDEEDVEAERYKTSERTIREAISEATDILSKYSNRELTIKVQKDEVRIQIQSPEPASPESNGSPVEEPECPSRPLIWPYCYAPTFQTMQSWFGYHPGDGRAYPRPLLDPWRTPMGHRPQWFQPYPIMESAVHRVGNSIDSYTVPHWSYGRHHVESPESPVVPGHIPLIIEKEDDDERMDSPPPETTVQTCKQPDKKSEQSVPEVVQQPEDKPPDEDLLLSDHSDGYSETYTEVDEDALLEDLVPQQPTNEVPQPKEPEVLIIQDVVIKTAVQEQNDPETVEPSNVEPTSEIEMEPTDQTVAPTEPQNEAVFAPDRTVFPEGATPELLEAGNTLLWLSNVALSSTVPEPEEAPKENEMSAYVHPEMASTDTILAPEDVGYAQEIEVEETVQNPPENEFYQSNLQESSENNLPTDTIATLKPAKVPQTYIQSPTENKLLPHPGFSLLRYESGEAQRPETTDSSDSEIRLKIDERGDSSPEHSLTVPVRPYRTKAEMKQGTAKIPSDESDDDIPLKFHKGTKTRNRRPSSSPRGRKRNGSGRRKTESQQYTSKLRSRSQSTSKEEELVSLENVTPPKPRGRPKKVPPPVPNPTEPTTLIETVLVTSKALLVEESCATLNLATTPPKKRMALLRKMNKLLDDTTKRLKERQGMPEDTEEMFTFDSNKILEVQQEVEIVMTEKKAEINDRVLRSSKEFDIPLSEECLSLKRTPEVLEKSKLNQKIKSSKSSSSKVEFAHPDSSPKQLGGALKKTKKVTKNQIAKNDSADSFSNQILTSELDGKKSKKSLNSPSSEPVKTLNKTSKKLDSMVNSKQLDDFVNKPEVEQLSQKIKPPRTSSKSPSKMQALILDVDTSDTSKASYKSLKKSKSGANNEVLTTETVKSLNKLARCTSEQPKSNNSKKLDAASKTTRRSSDSQLLKSVSKSPRASISLDLDASGINSKQADELTNKPSKDTKLSDLDHKVEKIKSKSYSKLDEATVKKSSKSSNNQIADNERDDSLSKSPILITSSKQLQEPEISLEHSEPVVEKVTTRRSSKSLSLDLEVSKSSVKPPEGTLKKSRRGSNSQIVEPIKSSNNLTAEVECFKIKNVEKTSPDQILEKELIGTSSPNQIEPTKHLDLSEEFSRRSNSLTVENTAATPSSTSPSRMRSSEKQTLDLEGSKKVTKTSNCQIIEKELVKQEEISSNNQIVENEPEKISIKSPTQMDPSILSNNPTVDLDTTEATLKHLEKTSKKSRRNSNHQNMEDKPKKVSSQMQPSRTSNKSDSAEINLKSTNSANNEPVKSLSQSPSEMQMEVSKKLSNSQIKENEPEKTIMELPTQVENLRPSKKSLKPEEQTARSSNCQIIEKEPVEQEEVNNRIVENEPEKTSIKSPTQMDPTSDLDTTVTSLKHLEKTSKKSRRNSNHQNMEDKPKKVSSQMQPSRTSNKSDSAEINLKDKSTNSVNNEPVASSSQSPSGMQMEVSKKLSNSQIKENEPEKTIMELPTQVENLRTSKKSLKPEEQTASSNCQIIEKAPVEQEEVNNQIVENEPEKTSIKSPTQMDPTILSNNPTADLDTTVTSLKHLEKTSRKSRRNSSHQSMEDKPKNVSSRMQPSRTSNKPDSSEINLKSTSSVNNEPVTSSSQSPSGMQSLSDLEVPKKLSNSQTQVENPKTSNKSSEDNFRQPVERTKTARSSSKSPSRMQPSKVSKTLDSLKHLEETFKSGKSSDNQIVEKKPGKSSVQPPKTANNEKPPVEDTESNTNQEVGSKKSRKPLNNQNVENEPMSGLNSNSKKSRRPSYSKNEPMKVLSKHLEESSSSKQLKEYSKKTTSNSQKLEASTSHFRQESSTNQILDDKTENNLEASGPEQSLKKSRKSTNNLTVHFELPELDLSGRKIKQDKSSKNRVKPSCDLKQSDESLKMSKRSNGQALPEEDLSQRQKANKGLLDISTKKSKKVKETSNHKIQNSTDDELTKKPSNNRTELSTELKEASNTEIVKVRQSRSSRKSPSRSKSSKRAATKTAEDLVPVKKSKKNKEDDRSKRLDRSKNTVEDHSKLDGSVRKSRNTPNKEATETTSDDSAKIEEEPKLDDDKKSRGKEVKSCEVQSQRNESNTSSRQLEGSTKPSKELQDTSNSPLKTEEQSKPLDVSEKQSTTAVECSNLLETVETPEVQSEETVADSSSQNVEEDCTKQLDLHREVNETSKSSDVLNTPEVEEKDALKGETKEEDSVSSSEQLKDLTKTSKESEGPLEIDVAKESTNSSEELLTSAAIVEVQSETEEQNKNNSNLQQLEDHTRKSEESPNMPLQIEENSKQLDVSKIKPTKVEEVLSTIDQSQKDDLLDQKTSFDSTKSSKESEKTPNFTHPKTEENLSLSKEKPTILKELQISTVTPEVKFQKDTTNNEKKEESHSEQLNDPTKGSEETPNIPVTIEEDLSRSDELDMSKKKTTRVKDKSRRSKELLNSTATPEDQLDEMRQTKEDSSVGVAEPQSGQNSNKSSEETPVRKKKSSKRKDTSKSSKQLLSSTVTEEERNSQKKEDFSIVEPQSGQLESSTKIKESEERTNIPPTIEEDCSHSKQIEFSKKKSLKELFCEPQQEDTLNSTRKEDTIGESKISKEVPHNTLKTEEKVSQSGSKKKSKRVKETVEVKRKTEKTSNSQEGETVPRLLEGSTKTSKKSVETPNNRLTEEEDLTHSKQFNKKPKRVKEAPKSPKELDKPTEQKEILNCPKELLVNIEDAQIVFRQLKEVPNHQTDSVEPLVSEPELLNKPNEGKELGNVVTQEDNQIETKLESRQLEGSNKKTKKIKKNNLRLLEVKIETMRELNTINTAEIRWQNKKSKRVKEEPTMSLKLLQMKESSARFEQLILNYSIKLDESKMKLKKDSLNAEDVKHALHKDSSKIKEENWTKEEVPHSQIETEIDLSNNIILMETTSSVPPSKPKKIKNSSILKSSTIMAEMVKRNLELDSEKPDKEEDKRSQTPKDSEELSSTQLSSNRRQSFEGLTRISGLEKTLEESLKQPPTTEVQATMHNSEQPEIYQVKPAGEIWLEDIDYVTEEIVEPSSVPMDLSVVKPTENHTPVKTESEISEPPRVQTLQVSPAQKVTQLSVDTLESETSKSLSLSPCSKQGLLETPPKTTKKPSIEETVLKLKQQICKNANTTNTEELQSPKTEQGSSEAQKKSTTSTQPESREPDLETSMDVSTVKPQFSEQSEQLRSANQNNDIQQIVAELYKTLDLSLTKDSPAESSVNREPPFSVSTPHSPETDKNSAQKTQPLSELSGNKRKPSDLCTPHKHSFKSIADLLKFDSVVDGHSDAQTESFDSVPPVENSTNPEVSDPDQNLAPISAEVPADVASSLEAPVNSELEPTQVNEEPEKNAELDEQQDSETIPSASDEDSESCERNFTNAEAEFKHVTAEEECADPGISQQYDVFHSELAAADKITGQQENLESASPPVGNASESAETPLDQLNVQHMTENAQNKTELSGSLEAVDNASESFLDQLKDITNEKVGKTSDIAAECLTAIPDSAAESSDPFGFKPTLENAQKPAEPSEAQEDSISYSVDNASESFLDQLKDITNEKVEKTSDIAAECLTAITDSAAESSDPFGFKPTLENAQKPAEPSEAQEDSISYSESSEPTSSENSMHPIECLVPDFDNELLITDDSLSQDPLKISDVLNEVEVSSVVLNEETVWIPKVQVEFLPQIQHYVVETEEFEEVKISQPIHKVEEGLKAGKEVQLPSLSSRKKKKRRRSEDRNRRREESKSDRNAKRADKESRDDKDKKSEKKEASSKDMTEKKSSRSEHKKDSEAKRTNSSNKTKELKKSRLSDKLEKTEDVSKKVDDHNNQRKRKKEDPERSDRSNSKKAKTSSIRNSKEVEISSENQESAKKGSNLEHRSSKSGSKDIQKKRDKREEPKEKVSCKVDEVPKTETLKGIIAVGNILDDENTLQIVQSEKNEDPQPESNISLHQSAAQIEEMTQEGTLDRRKIEEEPPNPDKRETQAVFDVNLDVSEEAKVREDEVPVKAITDQPVGIQEELVVEDNKVVECQQSDSVLTVEGEAQIPLVSNEFQDTVTLDQLEPLEAKINCPDVVQKKINIINHTIIKPPNVSNLAVESGEVDSKFNIANDPVGVTMISSQILPGDLMTNPITPSKRKSTEHLEASTIKKVKSTEELQSNECLASQYNTQEPLTNQPCLEDTKILMGDDCLQSYFFLHENDCSFSGITETVASSSVPYVDFAFDHVTNDTSSESYTPNTLGATNFVTTTLSQNPNTGFDVFKASSDHSYADAVKSQDNLNETNVKKISDIDSKNSMDQLIGLLQPSEADEDVLEKPSINIGDPMAPVAMEYENWSESLDFKTLENYIEDSTSEYSVLKNFSLEDELEGGKNSDMFNQVEKFVQVMGIDKDVFEIGPPQKILRRNEPFTPIDLVTFEQPGEILETKKLSPKPAKPQDTHVTVPLRMSTRNIPQKQISVRPLQEMITQKNNHIPDNYMEDSNTSESSCSGLEIGFALDSGPQEHHFNIQISPSTGETMVLPTPIVKDTPKNPPVRKRAQAKTVQPKPPPVLTVPVRVSEKTKPCPPPPKKKVTSTSPHIQASLANSPRVHRSMNSYTLPLIEEPCGSIDTVKPLKTRKSPKGSPRGTSVKSMPMLTVDEPVSVKTRFGSRTSAVKISGATDNASTNWDQSLKPRQKRQTLQPPEPSKTSINTEPNKVVDPFDLLKNGLTNPSFEERLRASKGPEKPPPPPPPLVVVTPSAPTGTSKPTLAKKPIGVVQPLKPATNQNQSNEEDWRERFAEELKKRGRSESCL